MKFVPIYLLLLAAQTNLELKSPENGNLVQEPTLFDYQRAVRAPGIIGAIEDVQDEFGNPTSI